MKKFNFIKKLLFVTVPVFLIALLVLAMVNDHIVQSSRALMYSNLEDVPSRQVGLILGSRVYPDGKLSDILKDRTLTALALYRAGKINKILVSGDHGKSKYDEVNAVKDYLLAQSVPGEDIFLDHAGFDTYDSLYRAKEVFQVESVVVVTQKFHLPRALYIGKSLGLKIVGIEADRQRYLGAKHNEFREIFARGKAFLDVSLHSSPKFLGPVIPIAGDGRQSWD